MPNDLSVAEFDFDLAGAVMEQLVESFDELTVGSLTTATLGVVDGRPGVYQLFQNGDLVYVGKADRNVQGRLLRHQKTLSGRLNIDVEQMGFKALYIHRNWSTWATEDALLRHYADACDWNATGFGSNDPGRNRDHTAEPATSFNSRYPINSALACEFMDAGERSAREALSQLKRGLPYLLRYEKTGAAREQLHGARVILREEGMAARAILKAIAQELPDGWQATILPGRMLLYREDQGYAHGEVIWPE